MDKKNPSRQVPLAKLNEADNALFINICRIIDEAKQSVAVSANSALTMMYWHIGKTIDSYVLNGHRAEYGKQIVSTVSTQLTDIYGKDFTTRNLHRMVQFSQCFPEPEIVSALSTKLPWSHFMEVLPIKDAVAREFYVTMAASQQWSIRRMRKEIEAMLYERTLISRKPEDFIRNELATLRDEDRLSPDLVFKSPYFLDFTGLKGYYKEHDLEDMLLNGLQQFLIELGNGFTFVERQKRMIIDGEDFRLDLLFYHRKLHRLIAIDLKRTRFKPSYKGQMELYLRYLDKYEREAGEESPLGLLLCTEGSDEQIELLQLEDFGIKVAQYYTELPSKELLQRQLRKQIEAAHLRFDNSSIADEDD